MTTRGQFNTKSPTIRRILREAAELSTTPLPGIHAQPLESNLFEWHFTIRGPPATPYAAGIYHGLILLPPTYPLRPPSFRFLTPSGRFEVNREICLSISGHHEETWQPAWGVRTALVALRGFMEGGARGQVGGVECGEGVRRGFAKESGGWRCGGCGGRTNEEVMREWEGRWEGVAEGARVEVPGELRLGFKDEMGKDKEGEDGPAGKASSTAASTATATGANTPTSSSAGAQTPAPVPVRTHTPTPSTPHPPQLGPRPEPQAPVPRAAPAHQAITNMNISPASPAWLDSAIYTVAFFLVVMIVRRYVNLELQDY